MEGGADVVKLFPHPPVHIQTNEIGKRTFRLNLNWSLLSNSNGSLLLIFRPFIVDVSYRIPDAFKVSGVIMHLQDYF